MTTKSVLGNLDTNAQKNGIRLGAIASVIMAVGVLLGAFGSHGLKKIANDYQIGIWQTATLYLFVHAMAILAVAGCCFIGISKRHAYPFILGIGLFCGSLYALALNAPKFLGIITPIGGVCFVAGWLWLAMALFQKVK